MNAALLNNAKQTVGVITRHTDLVLVALTVAVLTLMIVPLPTPIIDTLIGANLGISFIMLMMSMYVRGPLHFSSFPTMLLFTTLFRVGLNIATTRLILLQADAGEIISTFGEFAIGGNFIVGAVVFIILTIIQFLVIAKGAERVSEVGARFTLDAMPGKQMSIDADLRAGVIDMEEAQRRRQEVSQESQMFGAMDGAMKFVKGDSIAGLIVAVVNIVGGTAIGVMLNGMTAGEALQLYGVLTIGDGLVSQIPSLLVAIYAGVLVTRSGSNSGNVGAQIGEQLFAQPKALMVAATLIFLFALIPGFPKIQLFSLAFIIGGIGWTLSFLQNVKEEPDYKDELTKTIKPAVDGKTSARSGSGQKEEFAPVVPIILDISPQLLESLDYASLNEALAALRRALYFDLGVPFPGINIRPNPNLAALSYHLLLSEIPVARGEFEAGMVMVSDIEESLQMLRLESRKGHCFLPDTPSLWLPEDKITLLGKAGMSYMTHPRLLAWHLSMVLSRHAQSFIGLQESKFLLDKMEERAPDLVREATRLLPVQRISDIFQRLVSEQVSIRDLRAILEAVIEWAPKEKDVIMLVENVRSALKRQISYRYASGQNILPALLLDPQFEETVRKSIRQTSVGAFLAMPPEVTQRFMVALRTALGKQQDRQHRPVLLASIDIRRYLRRMIEAEHYELAVLSYQELTPEISVQPVDKILL